MKKLISMLIALGLIFGGTAFINAKESQNIENIENIIKTTLKEAEKDLIFEPMIKHTVSIFTVEGNGFGKCSGVLIEENKNTSGVLTAKHCIDIPEEIYVDNNKVTAILVSVNDDLAYLIVKGKIADKEPVKLSKYNAILGETVYMVGYPKFKNYEKEEKPFESSGTVIRTTEDWNIANFNSISGCSGGPIFNEDAALVGILWGGFLFEETSIYEPIYDIKRFLKSINKLP